MNASPEVRDPACRFSKGYVTHNRTALQEQVRSTRASFLLVETELGITLADIALSFDSPRRVAALRDQARTAYETVIRFRGRASLTDEEADVIATRLAELKAKLQQLSESL